MEVIIAQTAGVCFGVKRALEMVEEALQTKDTPISCLGPLIHNPQVVEELENNGLRVVNNIEAIPEGRVVIRSHGVGPGTYRAAAEKGLAVIDATCPFVKNAQQLAALLREQGYQVVVFGERNHAEVRGIIESVAGEALVIENPTELKPDQVTAKVGLISQTTQDISGFQKLITAIIPLAKEIRVFNTICLATAQRQTEAAELSTEVEVMIVVGGKNSANTSRLAEICRNNGTITYSVETPDDIQPNWFKNIGKVGVTAGASTPERQIFAVVDKIKSLGG